MTRPHFPNPDLGSFDGENGEYFNQMRSLLLSHVMADLQRPDRDAAHLCIAYLTAAIFCATWRDSRPSS